MCLLYYRKCVIYKLFNNATEIDRRNDFTDDISHLNSRRYIIPIVLCQVVLVILFGCDVCTYYDSGGNPKEGDIFFTAMPLAKDIPHIYSISPSGTNLREVVTNGVMYSKPSINGRIVYFRFTSEGNELRICSVDGTNDGLIIRDS